MARKNLVIIRIILWLMVAAAIGWLSYLKIAPTGKISYIYDFDKPNFFIGKLTPAERAGTTKGSAAIKGEPVYFSLKTPRRFERVDITVKFKNPTNYPIMELGLLNNKMTWSYDLKPLENKIIDQLILVWPVVDGPDGARLIQREKKYDTIESFLSNLPETSEIALYDYDLRDKFVLDKYAPQAEGRLLDYSFRGSYQFYTYIKNEDLDYVFSFVDLNINRDNDPIDIKVFSSDGLVHSEHIADDTAASSERQASLKVAGLPEGAYRLSIIANDDIITKNIATKQNQFSLINKIWLASGNKKNLILYTNSREISVQTVNPASLSKVNVGKDLIDLNQTYKQFFHKTAGLLASTSKSSASEPKNREEAGAKNGVKIELAKDDIIISGDGIFSFKQADLFDPRFKHIDKNIDINGEKINYILTNYKSFAGYSEWRSVTKTFDLTRAYQENGKYQFLISIPGLQTDGGVIIKEIKADLFGTSLKQKINKYFKKI